MKELSIEEKAKRYDEALKVAKENYETIVPMDKTCTFSKVGLVNTFHHIFPELAESEDEKVRKELLLDIPKVFPHDKAFRYIAYLENQGEQKPNYCHHEVDLSDCSEEYRKAYYDGWNNCNQQHAQLKAEQNPAWSEEDDDYRRDVSAAVNDYFDESYAHELCNWLKSLKKRFTWKPNKREIQCIRDCALNKNIDADTRLTLDALYQDLLKLIVE